jgi:hypothetical protein
MREADHTELGGSDRHGRSAEKAAAKMVDLVRHG